MNALVMATVLLSGLAAGDGGDVGRAEEADAGEVRRFELKGEWEGTCYTGGGKTYSVKLGNGRVAFTAATADGGCCIEHDCIVDADDRDVSVRFDPWGKPHPCIYKLEAGRVHLCYSWTPGKRPASFRPGPGEVLWVLQRPGPRK